MTVKFELTDESRKKTAAITNEKEVCVIGASYPPFTTQKVQPYRQFLTDDGLAAGTNDMGVDGGTTNVDYFIEANDINDTYITSLNWIVGYGASGKPFQWANGTALINGSRLFYENIKGEVDLHEGIKSNQDLFRLSFAPIPTGWEVRHVNANNDFGYFISTDLTKLGLPFGIKLDAGSNQRLTCRIRDNAGTDADSFNVIVYGFSRFP